MAVTEDSVQPEWGENPAKLAMQMIVRALDYASPRVPPTSSLLAEAADSARRRWRLQKLFSVPYESLLGGLARALRRRATLVTDREWDSLIVLDACRYDAFRATSGIGEKIRSPGTDTLTWVHANFVENPERFRLEDVTLVTANPISSEEYFELNGWTFPLGRCVDLWKDSWNGELQTVHPADVLKRVRGLRGKARRFIIHFLQPHAPYIGEKPLNVGSAELAYVRREYGEFADMHPGNIVWWLLRDRVISRRRVKQAYDANLSFVWSYAVPLAAMLPGKVALTADHGELLGEYGLYSHPPGLYVPELCDVPWVDLHRPGETENLPPLSKGN